MLPRHNSTTLPPKTILSVREHMYAIQMWSTIRPILLNHAEDIFIKYLSDYPHNKVYFSFITHEMTNDELRTLVPLKRHAKLVIKALSHFLDNLDVPLNMKREMLRIGKVHSKLNIQKKAFEELRKSILCFLTKINRDKMSRQDFNIWDKVFYVVFNLHVDYMDDIRDNLQLEPKGKGKKMKETSSDHYFKRSLSKNIENWEDLTNVRKDDKGSISSNCAILHM